ncbi:17.4 kDa class III heat shock protein-like [Salvia splendens]|uniref:17.4 kDa class III heat shock protein-like n=1 Tax=Salvia splendens TaxID=180675 RepID=UPI001C25AA74|nr:17.4 kDa class III heat shock protein-like [Salvia splendens]
MGGLRLQKCEISGPSLRLPSSSISPIGGFKKVGKGIRDYDEIALSLKLESSCSDTILTMVTVEEENTLVIKSNGKRKTKEGEEEGCKYIRLERRPPQKLTRKFRLPDNCNVSAISAKCENGVLTVVVEKLPPLPKSKSIEVAIS